MITIWNQREVYIGYPSERLIKIIGILKENNIKFKKRVFNDDSMHFFNSKVFSLDFFGIGDDRSKIYYIYVHKDDYDKACDVLQCVQTLSDRTS